MASTKVIIVGAGIAGPVLGMLLKMRGYNPIVYERLPAFSTAGLSLVLQLNGLRLLSQIPDFVPNIPGRPLYQLSSYSTLSSDPGLLHSSNLPSRLAEMFGMRMTAVARHTFHRYIIDRAEEMGVPIVWGHQVDGVEELDGKAEGGNEGEEGEGGTGMVRVLFKDGGSDVGSWVIGCDGLHSGVRRAIFGEVAADYTGVSQTGGISPTPATLAATPTMANFYGLGAHMIAYPVSDTHTSWAVTLPEQKLKETWQAADKHVLEEFQSSEYANWNDGAGELIKTTEKLIKYGLYDRPELKAWHKGRVVLLGDAAHPTSPHLGQGANQAFSDISLLLSLLDTHNPTRTPPSTSTLSVIFTAFETERIKVSAPIVKDARARGEYRVMKGEKECRERNEEMRKEGDKDIVRLYARLVEELGAGEQVMRQIEESA